MTHHVTTIDGHTVAITGPDAEGLARRLSGRLEPVAYVESSVRGVGGFHCRLLSHTMPSFGTKLYTAPPDTEALLRKALECIGADCAPLTTEHAKRRMQTIAAIRKHLGETT